MKYYIKTFGCQMNESDSERIASFVDSYGLKETGNVKKADLVIFNTCGVRQTAEDRVYGQVHNIRTWNMKPRKSRILGKRGGHGTECKIVITGCLAHRKDVQRKLNDKVDLFFSIKDLSKFENWLIKNFSEISEPPHSPLLSKEGKQGRFNKDDYLSLSPKYAKKDSAFVPIMTGCNNFCSYCVVPYARGREKSRPVEEVFKEIQGLSEKGYEEVTLLGQNVNSYHGTHNPVNPEYSGNGAVMEHGTKIKFPGLLEKLAKRFPNIVFTFLTSHPKDFSDELVEVIVKNKNISRNIHLPIQSGSNKVLKDMNRPYTKKHYLNLIEKIRKNIPDAEISTDVIVGFPTETLEDFKETVDVFKKVGYSEAFVNKYSPRPETAALSLGDPIPWHEKKRREKILRELL